jgi:hypothetical protein
MDSHVRAHVKKHIENYRNYPKLYQEYEKRLSLLGFFEVVSFGRASHNGRPSIPPITLGKIARGDF